MARLTNDKSEQRIAICSSLPPPFGGVSVHVNRLIERMRKTEINFRVYEQCGKNIPERNVVPCSKTLWHFLKFLLKVPERIVNLHTSKILTIMMALFLLRLRRRKVILTLHSEHPMRFYQTTGNLQRWALRCSLLNVLHVICVNKRIEDWLRQVGVKEKRITVAPAFLPPSEAETAEWNLSAEICDFLKTHSPIIGTHGWFGYFIGNIHVYSFDMIIDLIKKLRRRYPAVGFYTVISGTYNKEHRELIYLRRKEFHLENNWLILEQPFNAVALYARSDLFVRPTITDGDSVSIRECLYLGVPVVASNAVDRPPGCVIFQNRDLCTLEKAVEQVLDDLPGMREKLRRTLLEDPSERVIAVYRKTLNMLDRLDS